MSAVIVDDHAWSAILADDRLAAARRKLSFHEIRLIVKHAQEAQQREIDVLRRFQPDPPTVAEQST